MNIDPTTRTQPAMSTEGAMAVTDGALGAAGHAVDDAYVDEPTRRTLEEENTAEEFMQLLVGQVATK